MSLHQPVNILLLPSLGGRRGRRRRRGGEEGRREGRKRKADVKHVW